MAGSDSSNDLSPGSGSVRMPGSALAKQAAGNLLWRGLGSLYDLAKVPGQVYTGEFPVVPGSTDPNALMPISEYAGNLAGAGLGITAPIRMAAGGVVDAATLSHFPAWHGTGAAEPFERFSNEFIGSGEGTGIPSLIAEHAYGHYISGMPREAMGYRETVGRYKGTPGSFLDVHVIPEQHELLDWDEPFSRQPEGVQDKLAKSDLVGSQYSDIDPYGSVRGRYGSSIYRSIMNKLEDGFSEKGEYPSSLELKRLASEHLDSIGIPGMKFSIGGYGEAPEQFLYKGDHSDFPGIVEDTIDSPNFHSDYVGPAKGDASHAVNSMIRNLESSRDNMLSLEKTNPSYAKKANYYNSDRYQEGIDWLKDNKDNFRIFQGATPNNYVIFHGRHLNITHWDGNNLRTLVPVDHDPFGGFSFAPGEEGRPLYLGQNLPLKQPTPTGDEALSYYIW